MKTYELTISNKYVHTWNIEEAIREIMQNAIDSETDGNKLDISYNDGVLKITNYGCFLEVSSLILGNSGKNDTSKYIGTYGEGFKLAIIVLLRNGIDVNIYTNNQKWNPQFRTSKKFGIETLHIDVEQSTCGKEIISFELIGIDYDTFEEIRSKNLAMLKAMGHSIGEIIETQYGNILVEKKYKGMMFVNGLYVQTDSSFQYGYDFKPEYLHLDRDRKAINYYKMRELTAKAVTSQNNVQLVKTSIERNYVDVKDVIDYMDNVTKEFTVNFAKSFMEDKNIDEDTFVGLEAEVKVANKEKSFIVESKAIAELVNRGLGKKDEYEKIKSKVQRLSSKEKAYEYYRDSDYEKLINFLLDKKDRFNEDEIDELIDLLDSNSFYTSYFVEINSEIFDKFYNESDDDNENNV